MSDSAIGSQRARYSQLGKLRLDYLLYLPDDYDREGERRAPLLLFLHGAGEKGRDIESVKRHGVPKEIEEGRRLPFVVVSPQCPPAVWWSQITDALHELISETNANFAVDTSRIYLTGMSMGGYGAWKLAAENPQLFAALAPVCGGGDPGWAPRLADVPIWTFHGDQDQVVPLSATVQMVEALEQVGADVRFTLYEGVGHDSWTETYANPELYEWFLQKRRS